MHGEVAGVGRATELIAHNPKRLTLPGGTEDRANEVLPVRAKQPRRTQDQVPRAEPLHIPIPEPLGPAVCAERVGRVPLDIGLVLPAVIDVVRAVVHQERSDLGRGRRKKTGPCAVDTGGFILVRLTIVDSRQGRRTKGDVGTDFVQARAALGRVGEVELIHVEPHHLVCLVELPGQLGAEHAARTHDEDFHISGGEFAHAPVVSDAGAGALLALARKRLSCLWPESGRPAVSLASPSAPRDWRRGAGSRTSPRRSTSRRECRRPSHPWRCRRYSRL